MSSKPLISVVMICYNHDKYIAEAVESILHQTYPNFEFIIVDDGSTDDTLNILKSYEDKRISLFQQSNFGPSIAINKGIQTSKGKYIALMSGDDVAYPNRLQRQIEQIEANCFDIVFSLPDIIGFKSEMLNRSKFPVFFGKQFSNTAELFRVLFYQKNFLCAPSCFMLSSVPSIIGLFNPGLIQLQDYEYWIRACKANLKVELFDEALIKYRYLKRSSLSSMKNRYRTRYEEMYVFRSFLDNMPDDFFTETFYDEIGISTIENLNQVEYEKIILLMNHPDHLVKLVGKDKLLEYLNDIEKADWLIHEKCFSMKSFFESTNTIDFDKLDSQDEKASFLRRCLNKLLIKVASNSSN